MVLAHSIDEIENISNKNQDEMEYRYLRIDIATKKTCNDGVIWSVTSPQFPETIINQGNKEYAVATFLEKVAERFGEELSCSRRSIRKDEGEEDLLQRD